MKKALIRGVVTLVIFTHTVSIYSQNKEKCQTNGKSIIKSGEVVNLDLVHCNTNLTVTTLMENTEVMGFINVAYNNKIHFKPADNYSIKIIPVPDDGGIGKTRPGDRTKVRGQGTNRGGKDDIAITIYPNPANDILTIETDTTILSYTIIDTYGILHQEGTSIPNQTISVANLPTGLYNLVLHTQTETITKTFYKN